MTEEELAYWRAKTGSPTFGVMNKEPEPYDRDGRVFTLRARDLFDKGGFMDGDIFRDEWLDYLHVKGIRRFPGNDKYWYEDFLAELVKELLLPQIPYNLKIEYVATCHNSVRCWEVEGVPQDQLDDFRECLNGIEAKITWAEIRQRIDNLITQGKLH